MKGNYQKCAKCGITRNIDEAIKCIICSEIAIDKKYKIILDDRAKKKLITLNYEMPLDKNFGSVIIRKV